MAEADRALAEEYATLARGSHNGIAVGKGPLMCPSCNEPWPCKDLRRRYPGVNA